MQAIQQLLDYLKREHLLLATAESCTAGMIVALLAECPSSGECLDAGHVVYSPAAKKRLLGVSQETLDTFNLTSEEIAREMAIGALRDSPANVAIATTGIAGPEAHDGIEPGTVCFAWAFRHAGRLQLFSSTERFLGDRPRVLREASRHALLRVPHWHTQLLAGAG
ncbi:CinA family protein [Phytopseudomonas dryadis]|uniref:Damage-inducible protein CinA n=1 Tax=Phytopseudomonas dryadis TaxID=2487520 RepID=A0ABY1Z8U6_9GAMM|nr:MULTISPECIES: CinA family protein [Pseudomonas]TBV07865.1 damage-inducible protein CinA [Pseudomonas dryadis]TBV19260.1 damage-inducible protein CinA [Pseudomonas sp. FRB 230]